MRRAVLICVIVALAGAAAWLVLGKMKKPAPPTEAAKPESLMTVTLYFGARDGSGLVSEPRDIHASAGALDKLRHVVEALLNGPVGEGVALFPPAVKLRGVYIDDKIAYVDFSREIVGNFPGGSTAEYLLVGSIVQTVCADLPQVDAVAILVDGEEVDTIGGHLNVSRPLRPKDWR